jgi:hypothetical protein
MTQEEWKLAWALICQIQDRSAAEQEAILRASAARDVVLEHVHRVLAACGEPEDWDQAPPADKAVDGRGSLRTFFRSSHSRFGRNN